MVFSSIIFIFFFLPIFLGVYFIIQKKYRNLFILLASLLFYFWGEAWYVLLMIGVSLFDYGCGLLFTTIRKMGSFSEEKKKRLSKIVLISSIVGNLAILGVFKYFNFGIDSLNSLFQIIGLGSDSLIRVAQIALPLGISFYTFQSMSYTIDVYRGEVPATRNIVNYLSFVTLFPQLVAGPIVRYTDISKQIEDRNITYSNFALGIQRFIIGLAKKVLIANTVGSVADTIFSLSATNMSFGIAWIGILCYAIQIFFDFSGYSDMAIGLGKMIGFDFLENFNYPYISKSIREFWQRWHISLSTWFRDYLYIPLGGSRMSTARNYFNLFFVFLLCGLWHGASWIFVIWGCWHGLFLVIERTSVGRFIERQKPIFQYFYTQLVLMIGWAFFRASDLSQAFVFLKNMFGFNGLQVTNVVEFINLKVVIAIVFGIIFSTPLFEIVISKIKQNNLFNNHKLYQIWKESYIVILILLFILSSVAISSGTYNPFIYFRF
jgi:alginate O-acetyltransferase complex protein AlgI